jgi:hypothetical protein
MYLEKIWILKKLLNKEKRKRQNIL